MDEFDDDDFSEWDDLTDEGNERKTDPREDSWRFSEEFDRNMEMIDKTFGNTENARPEMNRTKEPDESWSDVLYDLSQEMAGTVNHAFKIEYEEEDGLGRGTFKGPGYERDWEPDDEMAWIQGNPNFSLSANLEFDYEDGTEPEMIERAISAVNPNRVEITITNPENETEHEIILDEEQDSLEYEVDSESWITGEEEYRDFQAVKSAVQTLDIPVDVYEIEDPRDPDGNRVMDDFWADFTIAEEGMVKFEDYRANEEGRAERTTVPETASSMSIADHSYAELFQELREQGYDVSVSGSQMVSTEVESENGMDAVIHGPDYGFTVAEEAVYLNRDLEPGENYESGEVKQKMDEMEYWANEITGDRLRENRWEMNPINVIKPSQEQEF